jgi:hypothetical protein
MNQDGFGRFSFMIFSSFGDRDITLVYSPLVSLPTPLPSLRFRSQEGIRNKSTFSSKHFFSHSSLN